MNRVNREQTAKKIVWPFLLAINPAFNSTKLSTFDFTVGLRKGYECVIFAWKVENWKFLDFFRHLVTFSVSQKNFYIHFLAFPGMLHYFITKNLFFKFHQICPSWPFVCGWLRHPLSKAFEVSISCHFKGHNGTLRSPKSLGMVKFLQNRPTLLKPTALPTLPHKNIVKSLI